MYRPISRQLELRTWQTRENLRLINNNIVYTYKYMTHENELRNNKYIFSLLYNIYCRRRHKVMRKSDIERWRPSTVAL